MNLGQKKIWVYNRNRTYMYDLPCKHQLCALSSDIWDFWRVRSFNWFHMWQASCTLQIFLCTMLMCQVLSTKHGEYISIYSCVWRIAKCMVWILLNSPVHFSSENFNYRLNHSKILTAHQFCDFQYLFFQLLSTVKSTPSEDMLFIHVLIILIDITTDLQYSFAFRTVWVGMMYQRVGVRQFIN